MLKFVGDFDILPSLGFVLNLSGSYWFKQKTESGAWIFIDPKTGEIDAGQLADLSDLQKYIQEV